MTRLSLFRLLPLGALAFAAAGCRAEAPAVPSTASDSVLSSAPAPARPVHVLIFGDSITAGYGLRATDAFPAVLQATAQAEGLDVRVTGAGVSGETTAGGRARLARVLDGAGPLDVFVLELGGNDAFRGIAPATAEANLVAMLREVRARHPHARLVVAGMAVPAEAFGGYGALGAGYAPIFARAAEAVGADLVPFILDGVVGRAAFTLPDRLHPNAEGQRRVAATVWTVLGPVVRDVARTPVAA